jgi:hypothetical protein
VHSVDQVLRAIRLALYRRVEARLGLPGRDTVHICRVGDRFKWRQLTATNRRQRRSQLRSLLRLEVHIVDVLLLLERGAHGRRLWRAAVRRVGDILPDSLGAASLLLLIIVVLIDSRWRIGQILELHGIVSLYLEQALAFEEVLAPLERGLLLHLLER